MARNLLVSIDFPPQTGGKQTYLYEITRRLEDTALIVSGHEGSEEVDQREGWTAYRVPRWLFIAGFPLLVLYSAYVYVKERPDTVLCGQILPDAVAGYVLSRFFDVEYVVFTFDTIDIMSPLDRGRIIHFLFRRAISDADLFFAISDFAKEQLHEVGVDEERVKVVHPGVDTDRFRPDIETAELEQEFGLEDVSVLLTVSRLVERKGHDVVICALPQILEAHDDLVYLVVGDGPERSRLESLTEDVGVREHVRFIGNVEYEEVPAYYALSDVFVMPSKYLQEEHNSEGFGIVFIEANACGVPVIGGDNSGMRDAIIDGETGYLVDSEDVADVSEHIISLLDGSGRRKNMGKRGRERVESEFTWDIAADRVEESI